MDKVYRNPKLVKKIEPFIDYSLKIARKSWASKGLYSLGSNKAISIAGEFTNRLNNGEVLYLVGLDCFVHNTGAALVRVSKKNGIETVLNNEEERFNGIKHFCGFPELSLKNIKSHLENQGLSSEDIFCFTLNFDWPELTQKMLLEGVGNFPEGFSFKKFRFFNMNDLVPGGDKIYETKISTVKNIPKLLQESLNLSYKPSVIYMDHHDSHAYFPYAISPFAHNKDSKPVMISVIDAYGNSGPTSMYIAKDNEIRRIKSLSYIANSLGYYYSSLSMFYGGWSFLSSEGRYMGAAAFGDMNRVTNAYYKTIRKIFHFRPNGVVIHNRDLFRFHKITSPFTRKFIKTMGEPIDLSKIWNPDAVLDVENIQHAEITQERVDIAAAVQLVFEDALVHTIDYLITKTKSDCLVMSGGTALNCLANMHLLEHFDESYYERKLGKKTRLNIWVPPTPSDTGTSVGSAYVFAMKHGARPSAKLQSAYLCGAPYKSAEILSSLREDKLSYKKIGNINYKNELLNIADKMAYLISKNKVLGVFQGSAETGPRALGNRSFIANPCESGMRDLMNSKIKFREKIRPLAPIVTLKSAKKYFYLSEGAKVDNYDAYNYMALTVRSKPIAQKHIPAVLHADGTSRIQIVREDINPLMFSLLKAMKKYCGVEVAVNTSLNIGGPIVQTPEQAIKLFSKAKDLDGIVMVGDDGDVFLVTKR